ncbi:molecular chaperone TorD [Roseovarius spongiae]|uniref:Molecular chaperone TorD n=1 Tax=Roseovarius spongiae TaxID=2320272 RepID=A0A3A8AUR9_9RHOB|nr:molecular chaperone TorD family protein [Roseovarius spongiae]RKF12659.1 molecular chaperone TorD [Roseovarius spongiae]
MMDTAPRPAIAAEEEGRAALYELLASLLSAPPDSPALRTLAAMTGGSAQLGHALAELAGAAAQTDARTVEREYNTLFIGLGRGEILPFASVYRDGHLNGQSLSRLRGDMNALGIERAPGQGEPEDHAATLFAIMAGLVRGQFAAGREPETQRRFFDRHIIPWTAQFLTDLEAAGAGGFYGPVARLGQVFLQVEGEAFRLTADDRGAR